MPRGGNLSELEQLVLWAIVRRRDNAYGVTILEEVETRAKRKASIGSIYAALDRLEENGLVRSRLGEATPERGGRAKRYFRLTGAGASALDEARTCLVRMWSRLVVAEGQA